MKSTPQKPRGSPWDYAEAVRTRPFWGVFCAGALVTLGLGLAQATLDSRILAVAIFGLGALVAGGRSDLGARIAILALPFVALFRRVTAGPSGYVYNDPLVLLPLALMIPVLLAAPLLRKSAAPTSMKLLAIWIPIGAGFAVLTGAGIPAAAYGAATALLPLLVGVLVAGGHYRRLPRFLLTALPVVAALTSVYAILQWIAPAPWDLAWLTTQQDVLTSIGQPVVGQFRIFATAESPGALSALLGVAVVVSAAAVLSGAGPRPGIRVAAGAVIALVLFALVLTSVRTALFAIPVALLLVMMADREIPRALTVPIVGAILAAVLFVPSLLANTEAERARFDVASISQDQSFQERSQLLPMFLQAVVSGPLGHGAGSTQQGQRLSDFSPNAAGAGNLDNGYLTRLTETGLPGMALFIWVLVSCISPGVRRLRSGTALVTDAACLGIVVFYLFNDLSGPFTSQVAGVIFWVALGGLAMSPEAKLAPPMKWDDDLATTPSVGRRSGRHRA